MSEKTPEGRRLDRRGFLGAAAGVAAAGAGATAWGTFASKASARTSDSCAEVPAIVPKARRGAIHFTTPAGAWNSTALFRDFITFATGLNCRAWEFAGSYPTVLNGVSGSTGPAGWIALGSYAKTYGFRIVGSHDGPSPTSAAALGTAITKMNGWRCNQLGAGSGYPGIPGAGTAITTASAISQWQESAHTMNTWGQAYQSGTGPVLGSTPYGAGVYAGTALAGGRPCARYYRHFHSEQGKWIQSTGTKYDNHYISEVIYTETDPVVAFAESDQCWLLDGLWMSGGTAPSVGLQGPSDPHPGQGKNRLVQPDLVERYQDRIGMFHIKDLGANDQGQSVANVGDNNGPGNATGNYPFDTHPPAYGAVPWATDGSQDTVQFQKIYERFRHPECHEYLWERDSMSATVTSSAYWRKLYVQAFDMFDKLVLDRSPSIIRKPVPIPNPGDGTSVWNDPVRQWLPYTTGADPAHPEWSNRRPAASHGAPGPECPPELDLPSGETHPRVGHKVTVGFKGTWSRFNYAADKFCYQWLRDGGPHPSYNAAPIDGGPNCKCCGPGLRYYVIQPEDAGHVISCQVTVTNDEDSATSVVTESLTVPGCRTDADAEAALASLHGTVNGMTLSTGVKNNVNGKIDQAEAIVLNGGDPTSKLNELKALIAGFNSSQMSASQKTTLNNAINAVIAKYPCT